jgi:hypothetical protein
MVLILNMNRNIEGKIRSAYSGIVGCLQLCLGPLVGRVAYKLSTRKYRMREAAEKHYSPLQHCRQLKRAEKHNT